MAIAWWKSNRDGRVTIWRINYVPRLDHMAAREDALHLTATIPSRLDHGYDEFAYTTIRFAAWRRSPSTRIGNTAPA